METRRPAISLANVVDDDPELVALHQVAGAVYDVFEDLIQQVGAVENARMTFPGSPRERETVRRWTIYLSTLAAEMFLGTVHMSVSDMPRAQLALNRQLFEYFVRNQWMMRNSTEATRLLDSLQGLVNKEVRGTRGLFDSATRLEIAKNYEEWKSQNEDLDKKVSSEATFTQMCREVLGSRFDPEFFWSYGFPSILLHGKPHGVADVLVALGEGRVSRSVPSVWLDRRMLLSNAVGIMLQYASVLALNHGIDLTTVRDLNARFAAVLRQFGIEPEVVVVERAT